VALEHPTRRSVRIRLLRPAAPGRAGWYGSASAAAAAAVVSVVASSLVVALLAPRVPTDSAGVFYLVAVLAISSLYGVWWGLGTSLASAVAFNFFFLPPQHTLVINSSGDWLALAAFAVTAIVTSNLAARERMATERAVRRAAEAQLGERLATLVADGSRFSDVLPLLGRQAARALGARDGDIHRGAPGPAGKAAQMVPLELSGRRLGELRLIDAPPGLVDSDEAARIGRVLAGLIMLGEERERRVQPQVEAETLRRANALTTALLRTVSHDFRSPLTAISASAEGLRFADLDQDERDLLDAITEQSARLSRLVTNLLDLSRLESGAAAPAAEWFDVRDLIDAAPTETTTTADTPRIVVSYDGALPLVRADAAQLQRVLVNVLENAVKFSPADAPVQVTARAAAGRVHVSVSDHGPGIPESDLARIFQPFFRGSAHGAAPGSGLGLAIAHGLAAANGASLTAESAPDGGTTFTLSIPAPAPVERRRA
jgi:two-component system, OmpR family, sensor histidine kinase KdpD